ncbi:hypothetical protein MLD38_027883 [Melastoma candidum]|uniref:Uncharacterized protein n=1 Tax=Melastoma candidum TaxID=119954 RepID=A0ACB9MZ90_9MYRT|nr:hypothetical protein MLD38_027883 [Melastoma candidum]
MWNDRRRTRRARRSTPTQPQQAEGQNTQSHVRGMAGRHGSGSARAGRAGGQRARGSDSKQEPDKVPDPAGKDSDSSVEEFDREYFARFRAKQKEAQGGPSGAGMAEAEGGEDSQAPNIDEALNSDESERLRKQKGKQHAEDLEFSSPSPPPTETDSNFEVMNSNTYCTLYKNGNYVAHREEALLPGVVEKVGIQYKLEWRHTYASVWVRRVPEWYRFPKPDYMEGVRKDDPSKTSKEIVLRPTTLKRKVVDWFVGESSKRRRLNKKKKGTWVRRHVQVQDRATQTEGQVPDTELGYVENQGVGLTMEDEAGQNCDDSGVEGHEQNETGVDINTGGAGINEHDQNVDYPIANEDVIILGWHEEGKGQSSSHPCTSDFGAQSDEPVKGGTLYLLQVITETVDGFDELDEEMKLVHCQAMKYMLENVEILTEEFAELLDLLTARIKDKAHHKFFFLYGFADGTPSKVCGRSEQAAMEEFRASGGF